MHSYSTIQAEPSTSGSHCSKPPRCKQITLSFAPATLDARYPVQIQSPLAIRSKSRGRLWRKTPPSVSPWLNCTAQYLGIEITSGAAQHCWPMLQPFVRVCTQKQPHRACKYTALSAVARERMLPATCEPVFLQHLLKCQPIFLLYHGSWATSQRLECTWLYTMLVVTLLASVIAKTKLQYVPTTFIRWNLLHCTPVYMQQLTRTNISAPKFNTCTCLTCPILLKCRQGWLPLVELPPWQALLCSGKWFCTMIPMLTSWLGGRLLVPVSPQAASSPCQPTPFYCLCKPLYQPISHVA